MTPPPPSSRSRRRWWIPVAAIGGVLVVVGAVFVVLFVVRDDPEAKPVGEAVEEFRSSTSDASSESSELQPPPGVYELTGDGQEAISFPPIEQQDGSSMPMTIATAGEGCWTLRIDFNEAHWQDWDLCVEADGAVEHGGRTFQRWDLGATTIENLSTFSCDPPAPFAVVDVEPGTTVERSCTGSNDQIPGSTTSAGSLTYVGTDTVSVGRSRVDALHFRHRREISGAQTGNEDLDLWLSVDDLLPLRGDRSIRVDTDSPIGTISYTESGSWVLSSTTPRR